MGESAFRWFLYAYFLLRQNGSVYNFRPVVVPCTRVSLTGGCIFKDVGLNAPL
jgi:hypothetical protein